MERSIAHARPLAGWLLGLRARLGRERVLASDSGVIFGSNVANAVFGFAFWTIASRTYSAEAVGLGGALVSAMALIGNIALLGLNTALVREIGATPDRLRRQALSFAGLMLVGVVGLLLGLAFAGQAVIAPDTSQQLRGSPFGILGFGLACAAGALWLLVDPLLIIVNRRRVVLAENLAYAVVKLAALLLVLPVVGERLGIVAAVGLGSLAGTLVAGRALFHQVTWGEWQTLARGITAFRPALIQYALGNQLSALIAGLPAWLLPLIVAERSGATAAAHFYTAWMIATMLNMAPAALGAAYFARSARLAGYRQGDAPAMRPAGISRPVLLLAAGLMVPAVLLVALLSPLILAIFGGDYARHGAELLRYLALASLPLLVVHIGFAELRIRGRLRRLNLAAACLSMLTLVGSYLALPELGLAGVGLAWLSASTLAAALCIAFARTARTGGRDGSRVRQ